MSDLGKRIGVSLVTVILLIMPVHVQGPGGTRLVQDRETDWPLHNADLSNSRFAPQDQINASNVSSLELKWSFEAEPQVSRVTPLVIDGLMYFNAGTRLFAVDAATGQAVWTMDATESRLSRGGRGPAYGDGRIYALADHVIYAVDARTGELVESFGEGGILRFVNDALEFKYPGKFPADLDPTTIGYRLSAPPTYHDGMLYAGVAGSSGLIDGGLVMALDGTTGAIEWVFTTIPQNERDDGWEIAEQTWGYGRRIGGGIWTQPAIDPELGMLYFNAAEPTPAYDGTARLGMNLFTNSMIALRLTTGRLAWYYQTIHHDLWDRDLANGPVLFDTTVDGSTLKGIASFGKTCYAYILNRETGQPINPIVETAVPTTTDVPGEQPWPTQPIPYTSAGMPQQPFCAVHPIVDDPELVARARPQFHPFQANELIIISPGLEGGANWGSPSFSPQTGLLYVTGSNDAFSYKVKMVGDTLEPGSNSPGHFLSFAEEGETGMTASLNVAAYDPATGEQVWRSEVSGESNTGNLVTAGNVVFQGVAGTGDFFAFDARSGRQLFHFAARTISSSPLTYQVNGTQFVSVMAGPTVLTFGLP